ncbi:MAG: hypothetical protein Q9218_005333, partial [Villophora microphyllina]
MPPPHRPSHLVLLPYNDRDWTYGLSRMRASIEKYHQHCKDYAERCEHCLHGLLCDIGIEIDILMEYAPSKQPVDEYANLSQLTKISKHLLLIDKKDVLCGRIWELIDRKARYLEDTHLAKPPPRVADEQQGWEDEFQPGWKGSDDDDFDDGDDVNSMVSEYEEGVPIKITFQPRGGVQPVTLMSDSQLHGGNMAVLMDAIITPSAGENSQSSTAGFALENDSRAFEQASANQPSEKTTSSDTITDSLEHGSEAPPQDPLSTLRAAISNFDIIERPRPIRRPTAT